MPSAFQVGTNEDISSFGDGTRDYTTIATWESDTDIDCVSGTTSPVLEFYRDSNSFDITAGVILGAVTDTSYFRIMRPASGFGHNGIPGAGIKLTTSSVSSMISIREANFSLQGLEFENLGTAAGRSCISSVGASANHYITACIVSIPNSISGSLGFNIGSSGTFHLTHCLAHNVIGDGFNVYAGAANFYNCSAINCASNGFDPAGFTVNAINCEAEGCGTGFASTYTSALGCTSDDGTAPGLSGLTGMTYSREDFDSQDYHLKYDDTGSLGRGYNNSAIYDDDISGNTIYHWSVGFNAQASFIPSRRRGVGEQVSTFGDGTRDYTSTHTFESDTDLGLTTLEISHVLECYNDSTPYTIGSLLWFAGATTDENFCRIMRAAPGHEHLGDPASGVKFTAALTNLMNMGEANFRLYDLVFTCSASSAGTVYCLYSGAGHVNGIIAGVIIDGVSNGGSGAGNGYWSGSSSGTLKIVNCLAINNKTAGFYCGASPAHYLNCTSYGNGVYGFQRALGTLIAHNCLSDTNSTTDYTGTIDASSTYNASSDTSSPGSNNIDSVDPTYQDEGSDIFLLDAADIDVRGLGNSLASYSIFAFNDDVTMQQIDDWSIGFHSIPVNRSAGLGGALYQLIRRRRRTPAVRF